MTVVDPTTSASAHAILDQTLAAYGLQGLGDFAWNEYLAGRNVDQIMLDIRQTDQYKTRFPAMSTLAQRGEAITEAQYINYEQSARQVWSAAGLPMDMLSQGDYVTKWLEGDVSLSEVQNRIGNYYTSIAQAPQEVKDWYTQNFGGEAQGTQALLATFADPEQAAPVLARQVAEAQFGGTGAQYGYNIDQATAAEAAANGVTQSGAQSGFKQVQQLNPLFQPWFSEGNDVTAQTGINAVFGLDPNAQQAILAREAERQAAFGGTPEAGGVKTSTGTGLGTSNRTG